MSLRLIPPRLLYALPALACAGLLGFGYYLQHFEGQDPCPLCLIQRGFYYGVLAVFAIAALHQAQRAGILVVEILQVVAEAEQARAGECRQRVEEPRRNRLQVHSA